MGLAQQATGLGFVAAHQHQAFQFLVGMDGDQHTGEPEIGFARSADGRDELGGFLRAQHILFRLRVMGNEVGVFQAFQQVGVDQLVSL